ncbi:hypothetical protein PG985_016448 [Apiospora marii]|uniref:uncharacterized protein n=1 Tax=Apiospora marii TaxID=335849 RepID=UPI00313196E7
MSFYYPYGDYQPRGIQDHYTSNLFVTPMDYQGSAHGFHHHAYNPSFGWPVQYQAGYPGPEVQLPWQYQTYPEPLENRGVPYYPCFDRGIW